MTELQKKLESLDYDYDGDSCYKKDSDYDKSISQVITLNEELDEIVDYCVVEFDTITTQKRIDNLQISFNNLTRDIKEIKGETNRNDTKRP